MSKVLQLALIATVAVIALAGCGGGDDSETTGTATTPSDNGAEKSGTSSTVKFVADPNGDLKFEEKTAEVKAGKVTVELVNESSVPHDVKFKQDGKEFGGTEVITDSTDEATVDLKPGKYRFYCSVPGHEESGMFGTLTVK